MSFVQGDKPENQAASVCACDGIRIFSRFLYSSRRTSIWRACHSTQIFSWFFVFVQADKHEITQQLGVQLRDLRLLDPQLHASYPSALLCRDKALVVNLEHIKCIITKDEVLVLNADEESVVSIFVKPGFQYSGCHP